MSEKKKNKAAQQEAVTEETASAAQAGAPEQEGQPAAPAEDSTQAVQAALAEKEDQYLRLAAEYDNYCPKATSCPAFAQTVSAFLPVYDNLERALKQETCDEAYAKGVDMTMKGLQDVLTKLGVEVIPALGETFDPNRHNAVMHVDDESVGENTVVEVFQQGFICGEKVIRFAMVKVAN